MGNCKLNDSSVKMAIELGCHNCVRTAPNDPWVPRFDIYYLTGADDFAALGLIEQAKVLVRHSKSTFWLDQRIVNSTPTLSGLEKFAWKVFQQHVEHYRLVDREVDVAESSVMGAEWWVQIKEQVAPPNDSAVPNADMAIDLHYDKDEKLAEVFDLGFFPVVSTVSYWGSETQQYRGAAPTVVFQRQYTDDPDEGIREMFVSHPAPGKHIAFDGRLLHGAPAHQALRQRGTNTFPNQRITFLVNIWVGHQPCDTTELPAQIRQKLCSFANTELMNRDDWLDFVRQTAIDEVVVSGSLQKERIQLPFVGGSSTWADQYLDEHQASEDETSFVNVIAPSQDALKSPSVKVIYSTGNEAFIS